MSAIAVLASQPLAPPRADGRRSLFIASEVRCGSTFLAESLAYELHKNFGFQLWDLAKEPFANFDENTTPEQALATWRSLYLDGSGFVCAKLTAAALSAPN